jgi:hypothetical protein
MRLLPALVLLTAAGGCLAHDELPTSTWCADGHAVPVATLAFAGKWLPTSEQCVADSDGGSRECGQFDDDYEIVRRMASSSCAVHERRGKGDFGSVVFVAEQPASFLDTDHHELYRSADGLAGTCVRCEPRREAVLLPSE